jgi:uncharacterized protein YndB with AHSA1/START domain
MAPRATVIAEVGGLITWTHQSGNTVVGEFVELVEPRRIVFTFGWEREEVEVAPGTTTFEITFDRRERRFIFAPELGSGEGSPVGRRSVMLFGGPVRRLRWQSCPQRRQ